MFFYTVFRFALGLYKPISVVFNAIWAAKSAYGLPSLVLLSPESFQNHCDLPVPWQVLYAQVVGTICLGSTPRLTKQLQPPPFFPTQTRISSSRLDVFCTFTA